MSVVGSYLTSFATQQIVNALTPQRGGGLVFALDEVFFQSTEIPESLNEMGGEQQLAVHTFPGGAKTIQTLGAFPSALSWEGWLMGTNAAARSYQIDRKRVTGTIALLTYGAFSWLGYVRKYGAKPRNQFMIRYSITFEPLQDLSGPAQLAPATASNNALLFGAMRVLQTVVNGGSGLELAAAVAGPATVLLNQTQGSLAGAGGDIAKFTTSTVQTIAQDAKDVVQQAASYVGITDATQASPAIDAASQSAQISILSSNQQQPLDTLHLTNPNLYNLAASYYGDATLWDYIGQANGLRDPMPIGQFAVTIPPAPSSQRPSQIGAQP